MSATAGLLVLAASHSYAGGNYWKQFDSKVAPSRNPMSVTTKEYNVFTLDRQAMRNFLSGLSTDANQAQTILLPTPDKQFKSFHIWKTPMMEQGLADRYPDIQTFTAVSDEDPTVTAKLEYTLFGFSAMVYNGSATYFVDPYNHDNDGYYVAYYKKDFYSGLQRGPCLVTEHTTAGDAGTQAETTGDDDNRIRAKANGNIRHTYRLALSCTGEYAVAAVGTTNPSVAQVLSVMVATVNHINGYYEREFSVTMNLISNNDAIIYTDGTTDPYTCNLNLNCLIDEVNTNVNAVIGMPNYDIGHIFCTAGGGLAQLSAVCASGGKARGTSTSGGANDISTVLHEMGHQFSANHTFNSESGGCAGNISAATAYEPGAGISTMSYSGLCDPDNVGSPTDDYFHVNTMLEVSNFLTNQGSSCGTMVTSNVNALTLPAITDSFYIPQNTPFELIAPDAIPTQSSSTLLYNWEQWDLGNSGQPESGAATAAQDGPLFRSYTPTTSKIRMYPEYTNINSGDYGDGAPGKGQRLAKKPRYINFKLSARSIYQGWGVFQFMDNTVKIKVDEQASTFRVTSQSTASVWNPGEVKTVTWDVGNTNGDSVRCSWVNIYLSMDGGATFPRLLVANAQNTGSYSLTVPPDVLYTTQGRIKVKGAGNIFFDINKADIQVNGNKNPTGISSVTLASAVTIYPNPANDRLIVSAKNPSYNKLKAVLYNAVGQQVWKGVINGEAEISVSSFARGTYMLQVIDEASGARSTDKVVLK